MLLFCKNICKIIDCSYHTPLPHSEETFSGSSLLPRSGPTHWFPHHLYQWFLPLCPQEKIAVSKFSIFICKSCVFVSFFSPTLFKTSFQSTLRPPQALESPLPAGTWATHADIWETTITARSEIRWSLTFSQLDCKLLKQKHSLHFMVVCLTQNPTCNRDLVENRQNHRVEEWLLRKWGLTPSRLVLGYIWRHYWTHHFQPSLLSHFKVKVLKFSPRLPNGLEHHQLLLLARTKPRCLRPPKRICEGDAERAPSSRDSFCESLLSQCRLLPENKSAHKHYSERYIQPK